MSLRQLLASFWSILLLASMACSEELEEIALPDSNDSWIDARHRELTRQADALANWADGFFEQGAAVQDSPSSVLRIRGQFQWDEQDDTDFKLRANGRLYLPRASERLSVVFLGQDDDFEQEVYDPAGASVGDSSLGLEYRIHERDEHKAFLIAGLKAGPKGVIGTRYRYQVPFFKRNRFRFTEEIFWVGGDGFGSLTRIDIDRKLSGNTLLRWANRAEYSEESNGVEWNSRIAWVRRLENDAAIRAFTFIRGDTDPQILRHRGIGAGYRQKFLRDWLFLEFEPSYAWRKRRDEPDREGVAIVNLRLEMIIGER